MGRRASRTPTIRRTSAVARLSSRSPVRPRIVPADLEFLEGRRLLSVAPVGVDDAYQLGADGRLNVDVTVPSPIPENPLPPPPAFDESRWPEPTGPFNIPEFENVVEGGQVVTEPDWVEIGEGPNTSGSITVRDPGSRWVVTNWLELAKRGKATMTVTNGGTAVINNFIDTADHGLADINVSNGGIVNARNWTAIGEAETGSPGGGSATLTVTGAGSRWNNTNFLEVGYGNSRGTLRVLDGATVTTGPDAWMTVGDNGGNGTLQIAGGSSFRAGGWAGVGTTSNIAPALGIADVTGANSRWNINGQLYVGYGGSHGILRIADGGTVTAANWVDIGRDNGADGRILVGSGSTLSYTNYVTIGQSLARTARGTLYIAEGGRVVAAGGQGFGNGPAILNASGGRILGNGTIQGSVTNAGFISGGGSVGVLHINGSLTQPNSATSTPLGTGANGRLQFDIGGTERGTGYDGIDVTGAANIAGGTVVLNFVNGFAPHAGDRFTLIDAASATSAPQAVEVRGLAPGFQYTLAVENGDLVLVANSDGTSAPVVVQRKGVLANDTDADGDPLTAILVKRPEHGAVTLYRDGSFSYVAHPSFSGTDTFQYKADDGLFESNVATVTITGPQQPPNDPPVAVNDTSTREGPGPVTVDASNGVLKNDTDDGRPAPPHLTAVLVRGPERGTLTLNPDGSFTYTPTAPNPFGDTFTYAASDGQLQSAPATVRIAFVQPNRPPVANPDAKTVLQNQTLTFPASDLTANDTDPDPRTTLTVTAVAATADTHGTVTLANGMVTYTPERNFKGAASFTYTVSDGRGGTAIGTVNVTVLSRKRGTPGTAVGHGTLNMRRQSFSFLAVGRSTGKGDELSILGTLVFEDKGAHVSLRSTDINLLDINSDGKSAKIGGTAAVNGQGGYTFEATAEDRSASGSNDRFRIKITGPQGSNFRYDSTSGSGNGDRIDRGGNIVITGGKKGGMAGAPPVASSVLA
jgi:T5SS/PEP-CTERM-associated repeat protein